LSTATHYALPEGWGLFTDVDGVNGGMAYGGYYALDDVHLTLDPEGRFVLGIPSAQHTHVIPPVDDYWNGTDAEWLLAHIDDVPAEQQPVLEDLVRDLLTLRDTLFPPSTEPFGDAWQEYASIGNGRLQYMLAHMSDYLHLTAMDVEAVLAALSCAVSHDVAGDPLWLMLVAPPSSIKTEIVRLLDTVVEHKMKYITLAGLLTQRGTKPATGLLARFQGKNAMFSISDFSALLGDAKQSSPMKAEVFNAMRDIYDGEYIREMEGVSPRWQGRVTMLAAATPAVDTFSIHDAALGQRWLQFRWPGAARADRLSAAEMVLSRDRTDAARAESQELAAKIVTEARAIARELRLPPHVEQTVIAAAELTALGRCAVQRSQYGRREVEGVVEPEGLGRLVGELRKLGEGAYALGLDDARVARLVHHAAVSSIPIARARVLRVLVHADRPLTTYAVAKRADMAQPVAGRALEELALVGLAADREDPKSEAPLEGLAADGAHSWRLLDPHGIVRQVLA
jgi:hypothetical protein